MVKFAKNFIKCRNVVNVAYSGRKHEQAGNAPQTRNI